MTEIKCAIIQDLLPLYIDEVVSQETKEVVKEHLQTCAVCQTEYEAMIRELFIPAEESIPMFKILHKKWRKKQWKLALTSVVTTIAILLGSYMAVFYVEKVIPYSEEWLQIEQGESNQLVSYYDGKDYSTRYETHPMTLNIDGQQKNVSFIYYTQTIAESPERSFLTREKNDSEQWRTSAFTDSEKIDAIYYGAYDVEKITSGKDSWDSVLRRAVLVWEK